MVAKNSSQNHLNLCKRFTCGNKGLAKVNLTGEILIVFNNEKGFNYFTSGKDGENKNIVIGKAGVSKFIIENLMDKEDFGRYIFKISKNIASSDEYMTYEIIGSE